MPAAFSGFAAAGFAIVGLGLALRINRDNPRPVHTVVTMYGIGVIGVATIGSILLTLANR